jgi:hypothetical protein
LHAVLAICPAEAFFPHDLAIAHDSHGNGRHVRVMQRFGNPLFDRSKVIIGARRLGSE